MYTIIKISSWNKKVYWCFIGVKASVKDEMNFFIIKCVRDNFTHTKYQIQGNFSTCIVYFYIIPLLFWVEERLDQRVDTILGGIHKYSHKLFVIITWDFDQFH